MIAQMEMPPRGWTKLSEEGRSSWPSDGMMIGFYFNLLPLSCPWRGRSDLANRQTILTYFLDSYHTL